MARTVLSHAHLNFTPLIEERTQDFTGRDWVFKAIAKWVSDKNGPRVFLIAGGPGTGKTAIAARVVQMHLGDVLGELSRGCLSSFHFCQAGLDSTLSPLTFVQSLAEALANRYSVYRAALEKQGTQQFVIHSSVTVQGDVAANAQIAGIDIGHVQINITGGDARPLFDQMVRRPLQELCEQSPTQSIVILVDSLDEALTFNPDTNIAQLLNLVQDFPKQVRFLLTSRSNNERVFDLVGQPTLDLSTDTPPGLDEVKAYAIARLAEAPGPERSVVIDCIAQQSKGNFLYAYYVLNDLLRPGVALNRAAVKDLPVALEDVYRKFLERTVASNPTRWKDVYRPLLGMIAVARGQGLEKPQLIAMTGLAEDTANDVLKTCTQYLVGVETGGPYRIYHQSFRDFLLSDEKFTIYPAERHAQIARYLQESFGANWGTCRDEYGLRYTPVHWAEAAALSEFNRPARTQSLIELTRNPKYQQRFDRVVGDISELSGSLHRAVQVATLNETDDMVLWLIRASQAYVTFHREYLQADAVVKLAKEGKIEQAEGRLRLFNDLNEDWQKAARCIIAWIGTEQNPTEARLLYERIVNSEMATAPLLLLSERVMATLSHHSTFTADYQPTDSLNIAQEVVKRISGQEFDRELLLYSINPSLIAENSRTMNAGTLNSQTELIDERGYAAVIDAPLLVNAARDHGSGGTELVDRYIDAHAGYNYVEYRNRSLWFVMYAVLRFHPDQDWVKQRLCKILVAALTGGSVDFREMLPITARLVRESGLTQDARPELEKWYSRALSTAVQLQAKRGADDSWGNHKRRLTGLLELSALLCNDRPTAEALLTKIRSLPDGFAGFQAPAFLRLADAVRACRMDGHGMLEDILERALQAAHHIQDYRFCARVTARCNALRRWHATSLDGAGLVDTVRRLAKSGSDAEFSTDHLVHEEYRYRREGNHNGLSIDEARRADTLEQLVSIFQRPAVDFRRLNPNFGLTQKLAHNAYVQVPDPGFPPLLAIHLAARTFADDSLEAERTMLIRTLIPVASINPTAVDTLLSYLLIAAQPEDQDLLDDIVNEAGDVAFNEVGPPTSGPVTGVV